MHKGSVSTIVVRRRCGDKQRAIYRLEDISGLHMHEVRLKFGGTRSELHGYVWCDETLSGELAHTCTPGNGAHRVRVCILRKDNPTPVYEAMVRPHP
jgi:hypothetical protein